MFGIVSTKNTCGKDTDFRNNYCGTCKTIAFEYGNSFRMALNFDVVFLSELYDALTFSNSDYSKITNYNCLNIPKDKSDFPFNLQYVAAVNVLLTKYKIEDNIEDNSNKIIWKTLKKASLSKTKKAELFLKNQCVNINKIEQNIRKQFELEKETNENNSLHSLCLKYSKQTSNITSEIFRGIIKENQEIKDLFEKIGAVFGEIVYLSDAIKDVEKDYKNNSFNLLGINFNNRKKNKEGCKRFVNRRINVLLNLINQLPIKKERKEYFEKRINTLYFSSIEKEVKKVKLKERISLSVKSAKHLSKKFKFLIPKYFAYGFSISFFLIITLLFPNIVFAIGDTSIEYGCCSNSCHCFCDCCCCGSYDQECVSSNCDCARHVGGLTDDFLGEHGFCKGIFALVCGSIFLCFFGSCFEGSSGGAKKIIIIKEVPTCGKC